MRYCLGAKRLENPWPEMDSCRVTKDTGKMGEKTDRIGFGLSESVRICPSCPTYGVDGSPEQGLYSGDIMPELTGSTWFRNFHLPFRQKS